MMGWHHELLLGGSIAAALVATGCILVAIYSERD